MGGGGKTGGFVTQQTAPEAAYLAGIYQSNAATAAAEASKQQTASAINLIREQYGNAFSSLKPYTTEGIQALNELNSYMGLQAYNPGTAPRMPTKKTWEDYSNDISRQQIRSYIDQNVIPVSAVDPRGGGEFLHPQYIGLGSEDPNLIAKYSSDWGPVPYAGGVTSSASIKGSNVPSGPGGSGVGSFVSAFYQDPAIQQYARQAIGEDLAKQANATYQTELDNYNQQMDVYNFAKQQYENYGGPLTPQQVQEKLMAQPGVGFQYQQGLDAIQRAAAAKGQLYSGRLLQSLADYGQGMASQQYGATLSRLAGLAGMGQQSASNIAGLAQNVGNTSAQLTSNLGDTLANSYLAKGNALANSLIAANQKFDVIGQQEMPGSGLGGIGQALGGLGSLVSAFSSKTLKDKVSTPSTKEILDKVDSLEIDKWKYKDIDVDHIGPYAEQFKEMFGVGDGQTINIIDMLGVLFASVKELSAKIKSLETEANHGN